MRDLIPLLLALALAPLARAHTIQGEVRVDGGAVDVVTRTNRYRVVGRSAEEQARVRELQRFLGGQEVTLEGRLFMSARGPYLVPARLVSPTRTQLVASGDGRWGRLRWRGEQVAASGLAREVPARPTRLDVYLFSSGTRVERVHVVGIRARTSQAPCWIRGARRDRYVGGIPLPPGNPTTLWDFTIARLRVEEDGAEEREVFALGVTIPAATPDAAELADAVEVREGEGLSEALRRAAGGGR